MADSKFVLDANVFIEAARRYYAFDLAPRFWESLILHAESGQIRTIDRVKQELERGKDQLAGWAKDNFAQWFDSTDQDEIIHAYRNIANWVQNQSRFFDAAKSEFASSADGWLVAYALVNQCEVVTHEILAPDAKNRVPLPDVCQKFEVSYCDTFQMLRNLGVRFS